MPAYHVEKSITIDAPVEKIRTFIEDFHHWPTWSPWLRMEPGCKVEYYGTASQNDHGYKWDGEVIGAGYIDLESTDDDKIRMDLNFTRPFKSNAKVLFTLKVLGENQTQVSWRMDSKMPFFLFFMIGTMKVMIGMDFEKGLRMLKEYVETGKVNSKAEYKDIVDLPEIHFVGVQDSCTMDQIGESMKRTLPAAHEMATKNGMEVVGPIGTIYDKVDLKAQEMTYTAFAPVKSIKPVEGGVSGTMGGCKALKVIHTGSYHHVGNGWGMLMSYQRGRKHKQIKKQPAFEVYVNDPCEVPESEIVTEIFMPIKK